MSLSVPPGGQFLVANLSAPDNFGADGPGSRPDFLSDDYVRGIAATLWDGAPAYLYSEPFRIRQSQSVMIAEWLVSDRPPQLIEQLFLVSATTLLTVGDTTQIGAIGVLPNGDTIDVTDSLSFTTYRTSRIDVANVSIGGLVEGIAPGIVTITASNEGATAVARFTVTAQALTTNVEGYVQMQDGSAAVGAEVILSTGRATTSDLDGFFIFNDVVVPVENPTVSVRARAMIAGHTQTAFSGPLAAVSGGTTDAGILVLGEVNQSALVIWDVLNNGTALLVGALETAGFAVTLSSTSEVTYDGTNPDPRDFGVVVHLNGTTYATPMPVEGQLALVDYVNLGGGFIHGEWNAYEISIGRMLAMQDITLLQRFSGTCATTTLETIPSMSAHPVLTGIPASFTIDGAFNVGAARFFDSDVLMTAPGLGDAVVAREVSAGRVVGFAYAGNYDDGFCVNTPFSEPEILQLYVNAALWAVRALN
jgi:hypothetical protein